MFRVICSVNQHWLNHLLIQVLSTYYMLSNMPTTELKQWASETAPHLGQHILYITDVGKVHNNKRSYTI